MIEYLPSYTRDPLGITVVSTRPWAVWPCMNVASRNQKSAKSLSFCWIRLIACLKVRNIFRVCTEDRKHLRFNNRVSFVSLWIRKVSHVITDRRGANWETLVAFLLFRCEVSRKSIYSWNLFHSEKCKRTKVKNVLQVFYLRIFISRNIRMWYYARKDGWRSG